MKEIAKAAFLSSTPLPPPSPIPFHGSFKTLNEAIKKVNPGTHHYGKPAGEVPAEHRQHAADILRERFKKEAARRKAAREAEQQEKQRAEKLKQLVQKFGKNK